LRDGHGRHPLPGGKFEGIEIANYPEDATKGSCAEGLVVEDPGLYCPDAVLKRG